MQTAQIEHARGGRFAFDTTLVLFFLAVDFGQSLNSFGVDSVLSSLTLAVLVVLPYYLPFDGEKPAFGPWLFGRIVIALFAMAVGFGFRVQAHVLTRACEQSWSQGPEACGCGCLPDQLTSRNTLQTLAGHCFHTILIEVIQWY